MTPPLHAADRVLDATVRQGRAGLKLLTRIARAERSAASGGCPSSDGEWALALGLLRGLLALGSRRPEAQDVVVDYAVVGHGVLRDRLPLEELFRVFGAATLTCLAAGRVEEAMVILLDLGEAFFDRAEVRGDGARSGGPGGQVMPEAGQERGEIHAGAARVALRLARRSCGLASTLPTGRIAVHENGVEPL